MKSSKTKKLIIVHGYSGAGKSWVSYEFAKENNYAWISQDRFLFHMFPASNKTGDNTKVHHKVVIDNLKAVLSTYMDADYNIVLEGALVSIWHEDPLNPLEFVKLAKKKGYEVIAVKFSASDRKRIARRRKRELKMPKEVDTSLKDAADALAEKLGSKELDTTKMSKKKSLAAFTDLVFEDS